MPCRCQSSMKAYGDYRSWLLVAGMVFSMTAAQLLFKKAGLQTLESGDLMGSWVRNSWMWTAFIVSGLGTVCWLFALRRLSLTMVYPWTAMIYVLTPLLSAFIFDDLLSVQYGLGMTLIVFGIFITTTGASQQV